MAEQINSSLPKPVVLPVVGWCIGICIAAAVHIPLFLLIIISILCLSVIIFSRYKLSAVLLIFILAGILRMTIANSKPESALQQILAQRESIIQPCTGEVLRVLTKSHDYYLVKLTSINNIPIIEKAMLSYSHELLPSDRFEAMATISYQKKDPVLDRLSFFWSLQRKKTPIAIHKVTKLTRIEPKAVISLERIRYQMLLNLDKKMGDSAPFTKALLLNDRTDDKQWIQQLVQGGLLHLIAISGLHVLFFYFIFVTIMNFIIPRRAAELIFLILMVAYAGLCQWSAPVLRAIIMILLYLIAKWMQRPASPIQIVCISLFIITLVAPHQLFSIGLQLSYLCVLTLAYAVPKRKFISVEIQSWRKYLLNLRFKILQTLWISTIVSLMMLPITLFYFYRGSLNGIIGNLLGIPLIGVLLPLSLALLMMPGDWLLFHWTKAGFNALLFLFEKWSAWVAKLPLYFDTVVLSMYVVIALYLIITAIVTRVMTGTKRLKLFYALIVLSLPFWILAQLPVNKHFTLTVFNAGLGDCILVEYPRGQTLMIDTGPQSYSKDPNKQVSWFERRTGLWQKANKINKIDILVLTHLHSDHIGGLEEVLTKMQVRNLLVTDFSTQTNEWKSLEQKGLFNSINVQVLSDTMSIIFGGSKLSILHPNKDYTGTDENDNSIVLRLDYKDFSALMTGDITAKVEQMLTDEIPAKLDTDFLKVPHHGSKYSSSMPFIRAVSPQQACITTSLRNRFHFPDKETVSRFRDYGIEPVLTGNGSVVVTIP